MISHQVIDDKEVLLTLDSWMLKLIKVVDTNPVAPYQHVYAFVKNQQNMSAYDLKTTQEAIADLLDAQSVNYGILMFMHGTYVFTEVPVNLNPVMVKLASGINFNGEVTSLMSNLGYVNSFLGR